MKISLHKTVSFLSFLSLKYTYVFVYHINYVFIESIFKNTHLLCQLPFRLVLGLKVYFSTLESVNDMLHLEQYISKPIRMVAVHRVTVINCFIIDFRLKVHFTLS